MNGKAERKSPKARVDIACGNCFDILMRFYMSDGRLTADSRHPARRIFMQDGAPAAMNVHRQWFRGMDVARELEGVTDSSMDLECKCGTRSESLVQTAEMVRRNWPEDESRAVRLLI